jgi:glycosyltransferase involved in cell wall biosynthesis
MRVALVSHELRSDATLRLRSHARGLASALARAGLEVEVFTLEACTRRRLTQRRRQVPVKGADTALGVTSVAVDGSETASELAAAFGAFLDREHPAVCHFESIAAFGPSILGEARERELPTVYCARDPWPAHDQLTLTLPDLAPFELGDCEAEARGVVAREMCPSAPGGGGGPVNPGERVLLRLLLHGDAADLAARPELEARISAARERVQADRAHKRSVLSTVDRRFAASRMLARQLSATVGRAFTPRLPGVEPVALRPGEPEVEGTRSSLLFMGSSCPLEGLDLLLDALRELLATPGREAPGLRVVLEATDPARDSALALRAEALGVEFECRRSVLDASRALGGADALVFPARWGQFAPASVRLAQASGLPVIAASIPGLEEFLSPASSILVEPGDVGQLAGALASLAHRTGHLEELRAAASQRAVAQAGGGALKGLDAEAREWLQTYKELAALRPAPGADDGPRHVQEFRAELAEVGRASFGELFGRVELGLEQLRGAFGLTEDTASLMARAIARGGPLADRVADAGEGALEGLPLVGDSLEEEGRLVPRPRPSGLGIAEPAEDAAEDAAAETEPADHVATEADPAGREQLALGRGADPAHGTGVQA